MYFRQELAFFSLRKKLNLLKYFIASQKKHLKLFPMYLLPLPGIFQGALEDSVYSESGVKSKVTFSFSLNSTLSISSQTCFSQIGSQYG